MEEDNPDKALAPGKIELNDNKFRIRDVEEDKFNKLLKDTKGTDIEFIKDDDNAEDNNIGVVKLENNIELELKSDPEDDDNEGKSTKGDAEDIIDTGSDAKEIREVVESKLEDKLEPDTDKFDIPKEEAGIDNDSKEEVNTDEEEDNNPKLIKGNVDKDILEEILGTGKDNKLPVIIPVDVKVDKDIGKNKLDPIEAPDNNKGANETEELEDKDKLAVAEVVDKDEKGIDTKVGIVEDVDSKEEGIDDNKGEEEIVELDETIEGIPELMDDGNVPGIIDELEELIGKTEDGELNKLDIDPLTEILFGIELNKVYEDEALALGYKNPLEINDEEDPNSLYAPDTKEGVDKEEIEEADKELGIADVEIEEAEIGENKKG